MEMGGENMRRVDAGNWNWRGGTGHGYPTPLPVDALLAEDPDLWLAAADMRAWSEAHPCECEALCECERAA
jgi:hypothetical protein